MYWIFNKMNIKWIGSEKKWIGSWKLDFFCPSLTARGRGGGKRKKKGKKEEE